jgi:CubicO group peptidase (beta-lactamase class C family)
MENGSWERYFDGSARESLLTSFSAAKSFVSALVGIAIDEDLIGGVEDPLTDYLPVSLLIAEGRSIVEVARQAGHSATMALDTYGHVFDELDGAERISAEEGIRKARAEARATPVRPARDRVARKKNETPRVAGLS